MRWSLVTPVVVGLLLAVVSLANARGVEIAEPARGSIWLADCSTGCNVVFGDRVSNADHLQRGRQHQLQIGLFQVGGALQRDRLIVAQPLDKNDVVAAGNVTLLEALTEPLSPGSMARKPKMVVRDDKMYYVALFRRRRWWFGARTVLAKSGKFRLLNVGPLTTAKAKHRNLVAGICPHTLMETDQGMSAAATIYFHGDFAESSAFAYYLSVRSAANGRLLHRRKFVRDAKTTDAYGAQQVTMNMPAALARGIRSGKPKALAAVESGIYMEVSVRRWLVRKTVIYRSGLARMNEDPYAMVAAKMTESKLTPGSAVCYLTASSAVDTIVDEESKFANEDVTSEDIDDEEDIAVEDEDEDEVEYENTPMTVDELPFRGSTPLPAIPECNCVDETGNTFDCQCEPTCECVSKHRIAPDVCLCKDGSENLFDCACDADCECVTGHQIVPASDAPCRCSECANGIDACMPADEQCTKCTGDDSCSCEEGCSCFAEHTDIYSDMPSLMDYDDESFENNEVSPAPSTSRKRKNDDCECADDEVITCACVPAPHREFALSPTVKQSKQSPPTMPSWSSIVAAAAEPKRATMPQPIISKPIAAPTRAVQRTAGFPLTFGGSWPAAPASPSLKHPSWAAMVAASSPQQRQTVSNIATPRAAMSTSVERPGSSASMSSPPVYRANSPTLARKWSEVVGRDQMAAEDAEWTTVSARKNSPTRF